jgi:hypothetical protein
LELLELLRLLRLHALSAATATGLFSARFHSLAHISIPPTIFIAIQTPRYEL